MITPKQKLLLKTYLKNDYSDDVLDILAQRQIVSRLQKPYSKSMIRNVFNGKVEHLAIESAILEVYRLRMAAHKAREALKEEVLSQ